MHADARSTIVAEDRPALSDALVELLGRPAWHARAACRGRPSAWWFPGPKSPVRAEVRATCAACMVTAECASAAQSAGVWGGRSEVERRQMAAA